MAQFKNKATGDVITAHGVVAADYRKRNEWEEVKETATAKKGTDK